VSTCEEGCLKSVEQKAWVDAWDTDTPESINESIKMNTLMTVMNAEKQFLLENTL
jgi:hypothetical protein